MTQSEIQHFFQQRYNRDAWVRFLGQTFSNASLLSSPELLTGINTDVATKVYKLGFVTLNEDGVERQIAIYEVTLAKGIVLERNRVGLRNLLRKYWKNIDAAFISFYNPESSNWRFTYVSELTGFDAEGEFISIKTEPKRYTYILGEGETCRTAAERFTLLVTKGKNAGLDDIKDAFSVEKLSKAFFDEYKSQYEDFVEFLTGKRIIRIDGDWQEILVRQPSPQLAFIFHGSDKAARDFCKKMLGRIVFLYFIQKKGWLGVPVKSQWGEGNKNFISDLFDKCRLKDIFYSEILAKLFFEALNRERDEDIIELINGITYRIPYLNGGLFEEENTEYRRLIFPAQLFQNLFIFFNQYNFTIYEDDPNDHTVAVDPEMLGHIFENLLEDNKDKGAYYTPKEIVHYMCQESLIEYLTTWFEKKGYRITGYVGFNNPDQFQVFSVNEGRIGQMLLEYPNKTSAKAISRILIEKLLKKNLEENDKNELLQYYDEFQEALNSVKICDPAIGSGAFPMGLLHEIYNAKQTIHLFKFGSLTEFNAAQEKLNIIQNSIYGVDIEKGAVDIARLRFWLSLVVDEQIPKPLPNLDYKIVVGDSLLSKLGNQVVNINWNTKATSHGLYGQELAQQRKLLLKRIIREQKDFFNPDCDKHSKSSIIRNIKIDLLVNQLEIMIKSVNQEAQPVVTNFKDKKKFLQASELYFLTLNWKQQIDILRKIKSRPDEHLHFFDWKLDFPEVMNEQVVDIKGFDIVIGNPPYVSSKEINETEKVNLCKQYKTAISQYDLFSLFIELSLRIIADNGIHCFIIPDSFIGRSNFKATRLEVIENCHLKKILHLNKVFDTVNVSSVIYIARRTNNSREYNFETEYFKTNNVNDWQNDIISRVIFKQNSVYKNIDNKILHLNEDCQSLLSRIFSSVNLVENNCTLWRGEEIGKKSNIICSNKTVSSFPILSGSNIQRYKMDGIAGYIEQKNIQKDLKLYLKEKVIVRQLGSQINACIDRIGHITTQSCYNIVSNTIDGLSFLGIINSTLFDFIYQSYFADKQEFPRILLENLKIIPLPNFIPIEFKSFVENILENSSSEYGDDKLELMIDAYVYKMYGLNYDDIMLINNQFPMTQKEYDFLKIK